MARATIATYAPASGPAVERQESNFGTTNAPPNGLTYPVRVTWSGQLAAPGFGHYLFQTDAPGEGDLTIDGLTILTTTAQHPEGVGEVILAKGMHNVVLEEYRCTEQPGTSLHNGWRGERPFNPSRQNIYGSARVTGL